MDVNVLDAVIQGITVLLEPTRMAYLFSGVLLGLLVGMIPGIGGITALALLLPFTFGMDTYAAFALLLGVSATTSTGDTIPAVLFGVPGGAGSAATVMDGYPMAKRGEAGRALSAAYLASLLGGLFGAILLAVVLPFMRPVLINIGSPELLAFAVLGISMVAVLSGRARMRGMAAAGIGIMLALIGMDSQTGTVRWNYGTYYLWDGLPLVPVLLGLFALPELCDLAISRESISQKTNILIRHGMIQGARDTLANWRLVLGASWVGSVVGAIPGLGGSVVDWIAYGFGLKTVKGARETFGTGDVRGVIAPESANNAKEGGALIPTIVFGIPGTASMTILLGAFLVHGLVPGPTMLTENLSLTFSMVWSIALANVFGAGLCYIFSGQFARIATLRYTLVLPSILTVLFIGAYEGSRQWGDLYTLVACGIVGWIMKQLGWPRPPLILGFVLGETIERYAFISIDRYGAEWLFRPVTATLLVVSCIVLFGPMVVELFAPRKKKSGTRQFRLKPEMIFSLAVIAGAAILMREAIGWDANARLVPMIIGSMIIAFTTLNLLGDLYTVVRDEAPDHESEQGHIASKSSYEGLPRSQIVGRAAIFLCWIVAFLISMAIIGLIPTAFLFTIAFMRFENSEPWRITLPVAMALTAFVLAMFDRFLAIPWPATLMGQWFSMLKVIPSL